MNRYRRRAFSAGFVLACVSLPPLVTGAEMADAVVDGLRMPAWVERQGERHPLAPGFVLSNRDRIFTGSQARVRIRLRDSATVALGADAHLEINALGMREDHVFTAALDVRQGAVRYSGAARSADRPAHVTNLRVGAITGGSRGSDLLWGVAGKEEDRICLLDGQIAVLHPRDEPRQLAEPLQCYVAPKGDAPALFEAVSSEQFAAFAAQTDMLVENLATGPVEVRAVANAQDAVSERPLTVRHVGRRHERRDAPWPNRPVTVDSEAEALALYDQIRAAGHAARIQPIAAAGGYRYTVRAR